MSAAKVAVMKAKWCDDDYSQRMVEVLDRARTHSVAISPTDRILATLRRLKTVRKSRKRR